MSLGRRLRELREQTGISQNDLADQIDVERSYISQIESGRRNPSIDVQKKLAQVLGTTLDDLLSAAGHRVQSPRPRARTSQELLRELQRTMESERMAGPILVPEVASAASAGPGAYAEPERWPYLPEPDEHGHAFISVPVVGECMDPDIRPGERVIVDTMGSPRPGQYVVVEHDGETLVKKIELRNGDLWLVANQHREPIKITDQTNIVGVVRMIMRRPY